MSSQSQKSREGKEVMRQTWEPWGQDTKKVNVDGKSLSYLDARRKRFDVTRHARFNHRKEAFQDTLFRQRDHIQDLVRRHLRVPVNNVHIPDVADWIYGRHNVNIPIGVNNRPRVFFRVSLPYKVGELHQKGNGDEKLRCEIAAYKWIAEHFPTVPIAQLHGLADVWNDGVFDDNRREIFLRNFASILVSLNTVEHPRIGSWTTDDEGEISLTNRPLTEHLLFMENEGVKTISRYATYEAADLYAMDLLKCHDNWLEEVPPAFHNRSEGKRRLADVVVMRSLLSRYLTPEYRRRPFLFTLTGLDRGDIFVDDHWNIVGIIDLE
ncbi:hypothetical protein BDV19DRAFT_383381 [Aspergillus venezuelensis]